MARAQHVRPIVSAMSSRFAISRLCFLIATGPMLATPRAWADPPVPTEPAPPVVAASPRPLEGLRIDLALTPPQLPLWQAYVGRLDAYTQLHYRERPVPPAGTEPATRQFGRLVDQQQNRLAALEDIERAAADLYAVLTPEQRLLADQRLLATLPVFASAGQMAASAPPTTGERPSGGRPDGARPRGGRGPSQGW